MTPKDLIDAVGKLTIVKTNAVTGITETFEMNNLVVATGKNYIASRMIGTTPTVMTHMAVGTGTTAPVSADTALQSQLGLRQPITSSTVSMNVVTYVASFPAGESTGALTEAGIFNASTAGIMLARTTFAVINKGADDAVTITWNITIA